MKNTLRNRRFIENYFKDSPFKPAGYQSDSGKNPSDAPPPPFMLFGMGWNEVILKMICIQFGSEKVKPHIKIEYAPCRRRSSYYYMALTRKNIQKLPRTEKEYFDNFHPKMSETYKSFLKIRK